MSSRNKIKEVMRQKAYKPLTFKELSALFSLKDKRGMKGLQGLLDDMEESGEIIKTRYQRYGLPEKMNLLVGTLQGHTNGFGFVLPDDPGEEDVFIPAGALQGGLHGDRVVARIHGSRGRSREGEVIRILKRANEQLVGKYETSKHFGFVVPDDKRISLDIFIPRGAAKGAKTGDKVVAHITRWPEARRNPEGKVVEVLGPANAPGVDNLSIIKKYDLPEDFPPEVSTQLPTLPDSVQPDDLTGRRDLRHLLTITIDGEDAKDLDDAVSLEMNKKGNFLLGVHIADVAHYVREGSPLDREALERGTSVYLADRVIPMFPTELSNDLCSLNPHMDRLTQSVVMELSPEGQVVGHEFSESVIKIDERMTYTAVRGILEGEEPGLKKRYAHLVDLLQRMARLARLLRRRRMDRGAIDFNFPEVKVLLDPDGKPREIKRMERSIAEEIIEEFMLACNETVAAHFHGQKIPFLYRIHERPLGEKMLAFRDFIHNLGYIIPGNPKKIDTHHLQKLLREATGKKEEKVINTIMLRTLQQARYSEAHAGHFGLAAENYAHFTSPIRRYPDLVIHRIFKESLTGGPDKKQQKKLQKRLPDIARHTSQRERRAMEAERESVDYKKIQFMEDRTGEVFPGIINGVTSFGFFVELDNTVEGLVHVSTLEDDYYRFIQEKYLLKGERSGRTFGIGDEVEVKLIRANKEELQVDFQLVNGPLAGDD